MNLLKPVARTSPGAEIRRPKPQKNPKSEFPKGNSNVQLGSEFGFRIAFGLRISAFGFGQRTHFWKTFD